MHLSEAINRDLLSSEATVTAHSFLLLHCPTALIDLHLLEVYVFIGMNKSHKAP